MSVRAWRFDSSLAHKTNLGDSLIYILKQKNSREGCFFVVLYNKPNFVLRLATLAQDKSIFVICLCLHRVSVANLGVIISLVFILL